MKYAINDLSFLPLLVVFESSLHPQDKYHGLGTTLLHLCQTSRNLPYFEIQTPEKKVCMIKIAAYKYWFIVLYQIQSIYNYYLATGKDNHFATKHFYEMPWLLTLYNPDLYGFSSYVVI